MTTRVIRKYANRRLYDSQESRHLTLDEVRQLPCAVGFSGHNGQPGRPFR